MQNQPLFAEAFQHAYVAQTQGYKQTSQLWG